jgi:hypothetical protein
MATKKSQVPPPPRPVQAPKRRSDPSKPRDPRNTRMIAIAAAGVLVVVGAIVGIVLAVGGGGGGDETPAVLAAGCVREDFSSMGRQHVTELEPDFTYNSTPATSGPHFPEWSVWNLYDQPVDDLRLLHNLEHGGIVVNYGPDVPQATVDAVVAWYRADPNGIIVAPRPDLGDKVAARAWTHLLTCTAFDEPTYTDFRDDYRYKGPENFPPESLAPGQL